MDDVRKLVNLTRHTITIVNQDGRPVAKIPPNGVIARLREAQGQTHRAGRIPLVSSEFGLPDCLPPPEDGTIYIVPMVVALVGAARGRTDLAFPSGFVKHPRTGKIIGANRLTIVSRIADDLQGG